MSGWAVLIKLPLYRIFMPVAVGVVFVFLVAIGKISTFSINSISFKVFLECFDQTKVPVQVGNTETILPNFVIIIAILTIIFVIGEVFSMVGEMIVDLFFCYCPMAPPKEENRHPKSTENDYLMEKIFPCSDKWLSYRGFVIAVGGSKVAGEVSEVHFVMNRFFAGLMAVSLATIHVLVPFIFAFISFLVVITYRMFKFKKINSICIFSIFAVAVRVLSVFFVIVFVLSFLELFILKTSGFGFVKNILVFFLFAFFFFLASIYYRSHANLLNLAIIEDKDVCKK